MSLVELLKVLNSNSDSLLYKCLRVRIGLSITRINFCSCMYVCTVHGRTLGPIANNVYMHVHVCSSECHTHIMHTHIPGHDQM